MYSCDLPWYMRKDTRPSAAGPLCSSMARNTTISSDESDDREMAPRAMPSTNECTSMPMVALDEATVEEREADGSAEEGQRAGGIRSIAMGLSRSFSRSTRCRSLSLSRSSAVISRSLPTS